MLEKVQTEFIKKTMVDQENIFQHQVRELHRLYSVEKRLIKELKTEIKQISLGGSRAGIHIKDPESLYSLAESAREIDQSLGEHSASCSTEILKMPKGFDLQRRAEQEDEMSTGVSATDEVRKKPSTDAPWKSGGDEVDAKFRDIELTLSIGGSIGRKRLESHKSLKLDKPREVQSSSIIKGEELSDSSNTPRSSSSKNNEKGKQIPWFFQDLSLSRT
ncbi:hypothetical protein DCAR_0311197 [Daucus carota subsp. sativus]|uniref:Uncharacterized protein n=1 Tax=Daucus carota subsp. sativus TaxID=79200 RepID=A0A161WR70_DAUCS|nr:PREDICTED: uncharacterized protein LOC108213837 [Daucus carota subsp. sativus]WOG91942.1 hypothetical protein DCAR_0311197 [Daucus carota subsp. sativus]